MKCNPVCPRSCPVYAAKQCDGSAIRFVKWPYLRIYRSLTGGWAMHWRFGWWMRIHILRKGYRGEQLDKWRVSHGLPPMLKE